jgi:hypothetical protein
VRIVKWLGDGAMLSSTGADGLAALVLEVQARLARTAPSLDVRAGLDRGLVIMFEGDDYIGRPVNVAARLCDLAAPGQLLATAETVPGLPRWIRPGEEAAVEVRGFEVPIGVRVLRMARAGADVGADPVCGLAVPPSCADHVAVVDGELVAWCSEACRTSPGAAPDAARPEEGPVLVSGRAPSTAVGGRGGGSAA